MASHQSESASFWSTIVRRFKRERDEAPVNVYKLEDVRRAMLSQLSAEGAQRIFDAMKAHGVLVKHVSAMHPQLAGCLRLTVGSADEPAKSTML